MHVADCIKSVLFTRWQQSLGGGLCSRKPSSFFVIFLMSEAVTTQADEHVTVATNQVSDHYTTWNSGTANLTLHTLNKTLHKIMTTQLHKNSQTLSNYITTFDASFEWAAGDVCAASIFDSDEIVSRCRRRIRELVTFINLTTTQLHLWRTINCHCKCSGACVDCVNDEST